MCLSCKKDLDAEYKEQRERDELEKAAMPRPSIAGGGSFNLNFDGSPDLQVDRICIFSCGHAYHKECLDAIIQQRWKAELAKKSQNALMTSDQMNLLRQLPELQYCPHCFSAKNRVDFDVLKQHEARLKETNKRGISDVTRSRGGRGRQMSVYER